MALEKGFWAPQGARRRTGCAARAWPLFRLGGFSGPRYVKEQTPERRAVTLYHALMGMQIKSISAAPNLTWKQTMGEAPAPVGVSMDCR